jgi:choline dehydrogenase-like flavoprotein
MALSVGDVTIPRGQKGMSQMQGGKKVVYDAIVVGSGASGGWACKRLTEAGMNVVLLEAGKPQSDDNFTEHKPAFELKYRNRATEILRKTRPVQSVFDVCNEYTQDWFVNDLEEPYTTPKDQPFLWMGRVRMTGGRTNVWGRVSLRFSDWDFKAASHDGYGEDWPLSYNDLAPYYDRWRSMLALPEWRRGWNICPMDNFSRRCR